MSNRLDRIEKTLDELVALMRILVLGPAEAPPQTIPDAPLPPTLPVPPPQPLEVNAVKCAQCGMEFSGITGYVCSNRNCPSGLGLIGCGVEDGR